MSPLEPGAGQQPGAGRPDRRVGTTSLLERTGRAVVSVVGTVVAAVLLVVPWLLRPAIGDGRWSAARTAGRWRPVLGHRPDPGSAGLRHPTDDELSPGQRWRPRIAVALVPVLLVLAGVAVWNVVDRPPPVRSAYSLADPGGTPVDRTETPAAFADAEWYAQYQGDIEYAATWFDAVPLVDGTPLQDFNSTHLNVEDGYRRTWSPPPCDCTPVTMWLYGASTVFGLGQRDDHTIASELAKLAWADGIALEVANRGIPAEQHWQEANRLRWDLTREQAPDLVAFYDGASDVVGASWLEQQGLPDVEAPIEPLTETFLASPAISQAIRDYRSRGQAQPPAPPGVAVEPAPTAAPRTPEEVGELAVNRYERARRMSVDLTEIHGLRTFWFWQPTRFSRPPVDGEPQMPTDDDSRVTAERAREMLPDGVVDLSGALDDSSAPIFSDDVHHNEDGARLVAAAMYEALGPTLEALRSRSGD